MGKEETILWNRANRKMRFLFLFIFLKEVNAMIKEALGFAIVFIGLAIGFRIILGAATK